MQTSVKRNQVVKINPEMRDAMKALLIQGWTYSRIAIAFDLPPRANGRAAQRLIDGTSYHRDAVPFAEESLQ